MTLETAGPFSLARVFGQWAAPIGALIRSRIGAVGALALLLSAVTIPWFDSTNPYLFLVSATATAVSATLVLFALLEMLLSLPAVVIDEIRRAGAHPENAVSGFLVRAAAEVAGTLGRASSGVDRGLESGIELARVLLFLAVVAAVGLFAVGGLFGLLVLGWRALFT